RARDRPGRPGDGAMAARGRRRGVRARGIARRRQARRQPAGRPAGVTRRRLLVSAGCALLAAVVWAAVALHQMRAHGRTEVNEMRLAAGLTWVDCDKVLAGEL